jgi:hypothetical protein
MQMRMAATLPCSASWAARLAMFSAAPRAGSAPCSSRSCASPAAGRPDFRFGLCEIGAFSSLLCWFWDLRVRGGGGQKTPALGGPRRRGPKNPRRFWGAPRPRNEKPSAVSRAGLGHTPEGYLFIHGSRFNVQKSQVEVASCTEVTSCTTHRLYSVFPRSICRAPHRWRPSNENPGAVSRIQRQADCHGR